MDSYTEVFVWGGDHFGQLGLGSKQVGKTYSIPRCCSFNILLSKVSCGEEHTALIARNGHVYTMGNNSDGRLGLGDVSIKNSTSPCLVESLTNYKISDISCGWGHSVALSDRGDIFAWGIGEFGALGTGQTATQWAPVQINLPNGCNGIQISCGSRHSLILGQDRYKNSCLLVFGSGEAGQLGNGKRDRVLYPMVVNTNEELKEVRGGIYHSLFLSVTGKVYSSGGNSFGQLGNGGRKSSTILMRVLGLDDVNIVQIDCAEYSGGLSQEGEVFLWGTGVFGEWLQPQKLQGVSGGVQLSLGGTSGSYIDSGKQIWIWGDNSNGELGQGDYNPRPHPSLIGSIRDKKASFISCGGCYAIALGSDVIEQQKRKHQSPQSNNISPMNARRGRNASGQQRHSTDGLTKQRFQSQTRGVKRMKSNRNSIVEQTQEVENLKQQLQNAELKRYEAFKQLEEAKNELYKNRVESQNLYQDKVFNEDYAQRMNLYAQENKSLVAQLNQERERLNQAQAEIQRVNRTLPFEIDQVNNQLNQERDRNNYLSQQIEMLQQDMKYKDEQLINLNKEIAMRRKYEQDYNSLKIQFDKQQEEQQILRKQLRDEDNHYKQNQEALLLQIRDLELKVQQYRQDAFEYKQSYSQLEQKGLHNHNESQRQRETIEKLNKQLETLQKELKNQAYYIEDLKSQFYDAQQLEGQVIDLNNAVQNYEYKYQLVCNENERIKLENQELIMKNKELFENLERELANRAREYKDKTITMLNTPSKNATITKSPIIHSPQTQSPAKQPRLFLTPNYEQKLTDAAINQIVDKNSPRVSPHRSPAYKSQNTPNGLSEMKERLQALRQTKTALESRMSEFEKRLESADPNRNYT